MHKADNFIDISLKGNVDRYYQRLSILKAIQQNLAHFNGNLLDAGCGKMPYKEYLLKNSDINSYTGLDIANAIEYDKNVKPDYYWNGDKMPFEADSFECVMATEVIEHVPEPDIYLSEIHRVLKKGGAFFLTTPFLWPLHEPPHDEYRFTPFSIERILRKNEFTDIKITSLGGWNASLGQMIGLWIKRAPMSSRKKRVLEAIALPFLKYLYKNDNSSPDFYRGPMITGISALAYKK